MGQVIVMVAVICFLLGYTARSYDEYRSNR
jgi:hypothetical protein